jgi:hypothetical protein
VFSSFILSLWSLVNISHLDYISLQISHILVFSSPMGLAATIPANIGLSDTWESYLTGARGQDTTQRSLALLAEGMNQLSSKSWILAFWVIFSMVLNQSGFLSGPKYQMRRWLQPLCSCQIYNVQIPQPGFAGWGHQVGLSLLKVTFNIQSSWGPQSEIFHGNSHSLPHKEPSRMPACSWRVVGDGFIGCRSGRRTSLPSSVRKLCPHTCMHDIHISTYMHT